MKGSVEVGSDGIGAVAIEGEEVIGKETNGIESKTEEQSWAGCIQ